MLWNVFRQAFPLLCAGSQIVYPQCVLVCVSVCVGVYVCVFFAVFVCLCPAGAPEGTYPIFIS